MRHIHLPVLLTAGMLAITQAQAPEMDYESYEQALEEARLREANALPRIAELETSIADLRRQIEEVRQQIESTWQDMLQLVGVTQQEYDAYVSQLEALQREIENFSSTYSDDSKAWERALQNAYQTFENLRNRRMAVFPRLDPLMQSISQALESSRSQLQSLRPVASYGSSDQYTVVQGDNLWKISRKPSIYGDPFRWIDIYNANRDKIEDPDLIFPKQELNIPR